MLWKSILMTVFITVTTEHQLSLSEITLSKIVNSSLEVLPFNQAIYSRHGNLIIIY